MSDNYRQAYVVKTPEGYVGNNRFNYGKGTYANRNRPFMHARLFSRKGDAVRACMEADKIVTVEVNVVGNQG